MRKEKAIVAQVKITKAGQVKHFQVKLPRNAKAIIGVEIGGRLIRFEKLPQNPYEVMEEYLKGSLYQKEIEQLMMLEQKNQSKKKEETKP